jgi:hypothetical protein
VAGIRYIKDVNGNFKLSAFSARLQPSARMLNTLGIVETIFPSPEEHSRVDYELLKICREE